MIKSPTATAPQPWQPSDFLPWTPISDISRLTHLIIFHLYTDPLYQLFLHAAKSVETRCGKICCVQQTAVHIHTYCLSLTCRQPLHCASHLHTNRYLNTKHKYTHISALAIKPPWTWAKLTAKAVWVMNQGEDQREARDRWANAGTARWCL